MDQADGAGTDGRVGEDDREEVGVNIVGEVDELEDIDSVAGGGANGLCGGERKSKAGFMGGGMEMSEMILNASVLGVYSPGFEETLEDLDDLEDVLLVACRSNVSRISTRSRRV
ncbi:hypothetical protein IFR05_013606 [Cadophora sp. M221]|nr:hypothetical protein IFR05_013606 [Cadophora sp. M221]